MTDKLELGKMSYEELAAKCRTAYFDEHGAPKRTPSVEEKVARVAMSDELEERSKAQEDGAPGRAPMLSVAQVKALDPGHCMNSPGPLFYSGWAACRNYWIRALLNIDPDAPSPLDQS